MVSPLPGSVHAVSVPLAGMLFTQTSAVMSLVAVPVLATQIAAETGIGASYVGVYTSLIFGAAMFTSAASGGVIHRLGPVRTSQVGLVFSIKQSGAPLGATASAVYAVCSYRSEWRQVKAVSRNSRGDTTRRP